MEPMLIDLKTKKKGLLRTILDDHCDLAMHKRALTDMLLLLTSADSNRVIPTYDDHMIDAVFCEIRNLKSKFQQLENSKNKANNSRNNSPNQ